MKRGYIKRRRGFTLIEVMITLVCVAFAIAVFGAAFPSASQSIVRSRHRDAVANACHEQLEMWRNVGYNSLPTIPTGTNSISQTFTPPSGLPPATGTVTFTRVNDSYSPTTTDTGRIRVDVAITWTGHGSNRGTVTVNSLIIQ